MMREVGVAVGIVPRYPGVTSALGCVMADMRHDAVQTLNQSLDELDLPQLSNHLTELAARGQQRLDSAGVSFVKIEEQVVLDMHYVGQTHTLQVMVSPGQLSTSGIRQAFEAAYLEAFGRLLQGPAIRVMNLRYARIGVRPKFDLSMLAPKGAGLVQPLGEQPVYHQGRWFNAARWDRLQLPVGAEVKGPAILEQLDTTLWLEPGFVARVDALGQLLISKESS
jgi:N-methylhydantoinase A